MIDIKPGPEIEEFHIYGVVFEDEAYLTTKNNIVVRDLGSGDEGIILEAALDEAPITIVLDGSQIEMEGITGLHVQDGELMIRAERTLPKRDNPFEVTE